jgi:hypothetical protein
MPVIDTTLYGKEVPVTVPGTCFGEGTYNIGTVPIKHRLFVPVRYRTFQWAGSHLVKRESVMSQLTTHQYSVQGSKPLRINSFGF